MVWHRGSLGCDTYDEMMKVEMQENCLLDCSCNAASASMSQRVRSIV